ncbi:MAG: RDD family protein [Chthoniobacteraceae bacterium]
MNWYYTVNGKQAGPVDDSALGAMAKTGQITSETLVWREGMEAWASYGSVASLANVPGGQLAGVSGSAQRCTECGNTFPPDELIPIGGATVCAACKPIAVQKFKEGVQLTGDFRYAGFWVRVVAKILDWLILWMVEFALGRVLVLIVHPVVHARPTVVFTGFGLFLICVNWAVQAGYNIWFVGKYAATPGKMACGLRVIRSSGEPVGYGRATGRFFSEILSGMIICIGYIMAAFDEEKRALHDRICDTRVIYK